MNTIAMSLRPVVMSLIGLGLLTVGNAWAGDDDLPLSLTVAETLSHDSNFSKDDSKKASETISTTTAEAALNKSYGRQKYQLDAKLSALRYKNNGDDLNNNGKDFNGSFSTELMRNWIVSANGLYDESLNAIQNNVAADRVTRNIRKYRDGGFSVQYGNGGTWAAAASYDHNKQTYSLDTQKYQDAVQTTKGLKAIYAVSDNLSYSLGLRRVVTDYDSNPSYTQTEDRNIDLSTQLQITGLSNLSATITKRSTSYVPSDVQSNNGWTGLLNWNYTPHGIFTYNVGFSRTTGSDRSLVVGSPTYLGSLFGTDLGYDTATSKVNNDTVTTSLSANVRAQLTGKISATSGYTLTHFKVDHLSDIEHSSSFVQNQDEAPTYGSYNHVLTFGLDYAVMRSITMGCSYQRYSQGADVLYHVKYSGNSIDCYANFTINPY